MADYPTLTVNCSFPLDEEIEDATVRSSSEAGYVHTRPRYTRSRKTFKVVYRCLSNTDKTTLESFVNTTARQGSTAFNWTHPLTNSVYSVRFAENGSPKYSLVAPLLWDVEFIIKEV